MNNKEQKPKKEIKPGPFGQRLEELNKAAREVDPSEWLYSFPEQQREKKSLPEVQEQAKSQIKKVGIWETIKRAIDEVFGSGIVNWKELEQARKAKKTKNE